jgi:hypothetical protein
VRQKYRIFKGLSFPNLLRIRIGDGAAADGAARAAFPVKKKARWKAFKSISAD